MGSESLKRGRDDAIHNPRQSSTTSSKRRKQATQQSFELTKLYERLAAEADDERLAAAKELITKLSPDNNPSAEAVENALDRLVKGLCSQRKAARYGFFVTLTEILRQLYTSGDRKIIDLVRNVNGIIELVETRTQPRGNVSGQERRDHLIGRMFGYKAIIQSSILFEPVRSMECWSKMLDLVCGMGRDIPWLREECGLILYESIQSFDQGPEYQECVQQIVQKLSSFQLVNTPEGVAIWLAVRSAFPQSVLPRDTWHENDPLCTRERSKLARILKEDFRNPGHDGNSEHIKNAAANPNPIFAWDVVLSDMLQRGRKEKNGPKSSQTSEFTRFWNEIVDNNLFSSSASHERKLWGFKILSKLVGSAPLWALSGLFSPNLLRTLINQSKNEDRFLHAAALSSLKALQARIQREPSSAAPIFIALTSKYGSISLDKLTKTKTLEQILSLADNNALKGIIEHLSSLIVRPNNLERVTAENQRRIIADMLLHIVRGYKRYQNDDKSIIQHDSWLHALLETFVQHAYFSPGPSAKTRFMPAPSITDSSRKIFQDRLSSCLTHLHQVGNDMDVSFPFLVVKMIKEISIGPENLEMVFKADKSVNKAVKTATKSLESLAAKASKESSTKLVAQAFILLYSLCLLQVYDGDSDAVLMLQELELCHNLALQKEPSSGDGSGALVEVVLTFLGNPRVLYRKTAEQAFSVFASNITADGLQSLTDILSTEETLEGQQELFAQGDDQLDDDDSTDESSVEEVSDVEMIDGKIESADDDDLEDSDGSSASELSNNANDDTSDNDQTSEDNEELEKLNDALAQALRTTKPNIDGSNSDESSDSDMDDDQMMALDPHLTKIFQQRSRTTDKKKQRENAKQTVIQFKSRVLELLSIYLEKERGNPLTLQVIMPVLRCSRPNSSSQIAEKSSKLLKDFATAKKAVLPQPENTEKLWELLQAIHEEAKVEGGSILHSSACSTASIYVSKILVGLDRKNYSKVMDIYAESQKEWFKNVKSAVQPTFFTQFQNWSITTRKQKR